MSMVGRMHGPKTKEEAMKSGEFKYVIIVGNGVQICFKTILHVDIGILMSFKTFSTVWGVCVCIFSFLG